MSEELFASPLLHWPASISHIEEKQSVADRAVAEVQDGQLIGIGSGSNAYLVLWAIGRRVRAEGLSVAVVCSSYETEVAAVRLGLTLRELGSVTPAWGVDGADEVDPDGRLIKGRGGALFREKILWHTAERMFLAVDASKHVQQLGQGFPVPIEVQRNGVTLVARELAALGATEVGLRVAGGKDGPVITESGNLILDARFDEIAHGLHATLKLLPGVIETGLFEGYRFDLL
ncbi:ribose 5-phosphate isomerase A [Conexibacter sp. DBS9H8]|uniref:ribose 5-phosphate isomerase A n=1 Tax=Conexibacter sp. DBS9H8 TaxID=2937801 RepID=UPI00200BF213|nr:ribose 5-phosphate isomerase A [Conexibacter sp. DBS9H8]